MAPIYNPSTHPRSAQPEQNTLATSPKHGHRYTVLSLSSTHNRSYVASCPSTQTGRQSHQYLFIPGFPAHRLTSQFNLHRPAPQETQHCLDRTCFLQALRSPG
jgi:hypothetical protein